MAGVNYDLYGGGVMGGYQAAQERDKQNMLAQQQMQQVNRQNQLGEMQLAEAQRAAKQNEMTRNAFVNAAQLPADQQNAAFEQAYLGAGDIAGLQAHRKGQIEQQAKQAEIAKSQAATAHSTAQTQGEKLKFFTARMPIVAQNPTDEAVRQFASDAVNSGAMNMQEATAAMNRTLAMPLHERSKVLLQGGLTAAQQLERVFQNQNLGGSVRTISTPKFGDGASTVVPGSEAKVSLTPFQTQSLNLDRQKLAQAKQRLEQETATGNYSPQTIDFLAETYRQTGTLPPLGMGKQASQLRQTVLDRAATLSMNNGINAADAAGNVRTAKMDTASQGKAVKDFSTGVQGKQVNAFNTAIDHLDTMDKLSDALINGDIKAFNAVGNMVSKQTGAPAPTNFNAAKQIVTSEIIKAVVASGGGVTERQEAEANFAAANSPAQLKGLIGTYKKLLGGQLNSLNLQYENTTGRKDFEKKLTPAAKAELSALKITEPAAAGAVNTNNKWLK